MKKIMLVLSLLMVMSVALFGCTGGYIADYSTEEFEAALNNGEAIAGKTVVVKVVSIETDSPMGYVVHAGENLNFVSTENPGVEAGDEFVATVERAGELFGSYIITYTK